jgi:predicted Zn-dependent protease
MLRTKFDFVLILLAALFLTTTCARAPQTGRLQFIMVGDSTMNQLGADAYQEILADEKVSKDTRLIKIVERVGARIAKVSNQPNFKWEFKVIDNPEMVNAFCLPGGKVAVYTGIIPIAECEAGLAVVLSHEIAHATARHGAERMSQQLGANMALEAANIGLQNNKNRDVIMAGLGLGTTVGVLLPYSRTHESEADEIGLIYMAKAGYDPNEASRFWERMNAMAKGSRPPQLLSTHPSPDKRSEELKRMVAEVMSLYRSSPQYGLGEKIHKGK